MIGFQITVKIKIKMNNLGENLKTNVRRHLEEEEYFAIKRAQESYEVNEAKRMAKNVKLQLIGKLRKQIYEIIRARKNINTTLVQQEEEIHQQIKGLKTEINEK